LRSALAVTPPNALNGSGAFPGAFSWTNPRVSMPGCLRKAASYPYRVIDNAPDSNTATVDADPAVCLVDAAAGRHSGGHEAGAVVVRGRATRREIGAINRSMALQAVLRIRHACDIAAPDRASRRGASAGACIDASGGAARAGGIGHSIAGADGAERALAACGGNGDAFAYDGAALAVVGIGADHVEAWGAIRVFGAFASERRAGATAARASGRRGRIVVASGEEDHTEDEGEDGSGEDRRHWRKVRKMRGFS
jgi:hypothetical protein